MTSRRLTVRTYVACTSWPMSTTATAWQGQINRHPGQLVTLSLDRIGDRGPSLGLYNRQCCRASIITGPKVAWVLRNALIGDHRPPDPVLPRRAGRFLYSAWRIASCMAVALVSLHGTLTVLRLSSGAE